jgi:hypothetical protein
VKGFQKELSMKDIKDAVTNIKEIVTKDPFMHDFHNLWPITVFSGDDEQGND